MAMVLILLLFAHFLETPDLILAAIGVLVLVMIWPPLFSPLARVWFGLSHVLGTVASKVLLSFVFAVIATPVGLVRRAFGADALRLKLWKKDRGSVMVIRDHLFSAEDLEKPY